MQGKLEFPRFEEKHSANKLKQVNTTAEQIHLMIQLKSIIVLHTFASKTRVYKKYKFMRPNCFLYSRASKHLLCFRQINLEIFEFGTEIAPAGRHSTIRNLMRHPLPDARQQASIWIPPLAGHAEKVTGSPCCAQIAPQNLKLRLQNTNFFDF